VLVVKAFFMISDQRKSHATSRANLISYPISQMRSVSRISNFYLAECF